MSQINKNQFARSITIYTTAAYRRFFSLFYRWMFLISNGGAAVSSFVPGISADLSVEIRNSKK